MPGTDSEYWCQRLLMNRLRITFNANVINEQPAGSLYVTKSSPLLQQPRDRFHELDNLVINQVKVKMRRSEMNRILVATFIRSSLKPFTKKHLIFTEPYKHWFRIRFRCDGILVGSAITTSNLQRLVARVKILSQLDISECRLPQDGRHS